MSSNGVDVVYMGLITPLSPLVHGEIGSDDGGDKSGFRKEQKPLQFRKMPYLVKTDGNDRGEVKQIPVISGNALRGMLRDIVARHLFETLDVPPNSLDPHVFHFLTSGGVTGKGTKQTEDNIDLRKRARAMLPIVRVFGGVIAAQHFPGSLRVGIAVPLLEGLEWVTGRPGVAVHADVAADGRAKHVAGYTRRDDTADMDGPKEGILSETRQGDGMEEIGAQQWYRFEVFPAGIPFAHEIRLLGVDPVALSMLDMAVSRFSGAGIVGGASRVGHGLVRAEYRAVHYPGGNPAERDGGALYERYLRENRDGIVAMFSELSAFAKEAERKSAEARERERERRERARQMKLQRQGGSSVAGTAGADAGDDSADDGE